MVHDLTSRQTVKMPFYTILHTGRGLQNFLTLLEPFRLYFKPKMQDAHRRFTLCGSS